MGPVMHRAIAFFALLLVPLFAAACFWEDGDGPSATPTPLATQSPLPTATVTETLPSPSATATATVPRSPTSAPATATPTPPVPQEGVLIEHGDRGSNMVALTFDMGGRVEPAIDIMNWLVANNVRSTIFMTGAMVENANTNAGREVLRIVQQHPELFELGNHSYTHPDFRDLSADEMAGELRRTQDAIKKHSTLDSRPLFRPPLGGVNAQVVTAVAAAGYPKVIMWDIDTIDWRPESDGGPTAADMVAKVTSRVQGGSIVLMHLGGYNTLDALPQMVATLRGNGFELARVSEMID